MNNLTINIRINQDILDKLDFICRRSGTNRSAMVRTLINTEYHLEFMDYYENFIKADSNFTIPTLPDDELPFE